MADWGEREESWDREDRFCKKEVLGRTFVEGVQSLYRNSELFDYTIRVEGQEYRVHKFVMAVFSEFFKVMLTSQFKQSEEGSVELIGVTKAGFEPIMNYIYTTRSLDVTNHNVVEILSCSTQLQINVISELCIDFLSKCIDAENCIQALNLILFYNLASKRNNLVEETLNCILENFESLVEDPEFKELSVDSMMCVLSSSLLKKSEVYRLHLIQKWLEADDSRSTEVHHLVKEIRFSLLRPDQLRSLPKKFHFLREDALCKNIYEKGLEWHNLPITIRVLTEEGKTDVRECPTVVGFGGDLYTDEPEGLGPNLTMYALKQDDWEEVHGFTPPRTSLTRECAITVINNYLIVCGGLKNPRHRVATSASYVFDPRTMTWSTISSMNIPRAHAAIAVHGNDVYVFGGEHCGRFTNIVEKYNFKEDRWKKIALSDRKISKAAACSFDDLIYLIGGQCQKGKIIRNTKEVKIFDPATCEWSSRPDLSSSVQCHTAFEMFERNLATPRVYHPERCIYVVPRVSGHFHSYFPSCCQWQKVKLDCMPPSDASVVQHDRKLYYINGWITETYENGSKEKEYSACAVYDPRGFGKERLTFLYPFPEETEGLIAVELGINRYMKDQLGITNSEVRI